LTIENYIIKKVLFLSLILPRIDIRRFTIDIWSLGIEPADRVRRLALSIVSSQALNTVIVVDSSYESMLDLLC